MLSEVARVNGLGTSLLERLFSLYSNTIKCTQTHTSTLLTNYRCHPSILMLASSLFYECTLLSRSKSKPHPRAPFPIVFSCSSMKDDSSAFGDIAAVNLQEAKLLVESMFQFIHDWPREDIKRNKKPRIGLLASTRKQVT